MKKSSDVRVRMAPSPTGFFHVGSARTALYNWLFARHHNGTFILRVEDTDVARSSEKMIQVIVDGLTWLGLDWDEGPHFQSQRIDIYNEYIKKLLDKHQAYYCYCDPKELEKERLAAYRKKIDWQYDRRCLTLSERERAEKEKLRIPKAVRFLVPDHSVTYTDIVHGEIRREATAIEDFIIMRPNRRPTYNLACVVDDYKMGISHVIRAVEHITNTPKQIALYEALGLPKPEFAHLPLILGEDKKKLSKRHGAVSVMWYKEQGFLPEAMVNYLSLLGWSPGDDTEIMKKEELIHRFNLERINPANAVFDMAKLEWMNLHYILDLTDEELLSHLQPYLIRFNLMDETTMITKHDWLIHVCRLMKPRLKVLSDINEKGRFFFVEDFHYNNEVLTKHLDENTRALLEKFLPALEGIEHFDAPSIEQTVRDFAAVHKVKARAIIHPLRVYVTGQEGGPGLFETLELIGKERCTKRINNILSRYGRIHGR
jgi:glutamyl-tRNA synthetase/nondiscriminating glutamyl-tRNA synthetase